MPICFHSNEVVEKNEEGLSVGNRGYGESEMDVGNQEEDKTKRTGNERERTRR